MNFLTSCATISFSSIIVPHVFEVVHANGNVALKTITEEMRFKVQDTCLPVNVLVWDLAHESLLGKWGTAVGNSEMVNKGSGVKFYTAVCCKGWALFLELNANFWLIVIGMQRKWTERNVNKRLTPIYFRISYWILCYMKFNAFQLASSVMVTGKAYEPVAVA
jgi:hypothetical protein